MRFSSSPIAPISATMDKIGNSHTNIMHMGTIDGQPDQHHERQIDSFLVRHHLKSLSHSPDFSYTVVHLLGAQNRRSLGSAVSKTPTMATGKSKSAKPSCSDCKRSSHSIDFCILSGGEMVGRSIDEARAAQHAALGKPPRRGRGENECSKSSNTTTATHVAPTPSIDPSTLPFSSMTINGILYHLAPLATSSATTATSALAHYSDDNIPLYGEFVEYHGFPLSFRSLRRYP